MYTTVQNNKIKHNNGFLTYNNNKIGSVAHCA